MCFTFLVRTIVSARAVAIARTNNTLFFELMHFDINYSGHQNYVIVLTENGVVEVNKSKDGRVN